MVFDTRFEIISLEKISEVCVRLPVWYAYNCCDAFGLCHLAPCSLNMAYGRTNEINFVAPQFLSEEIDARSSRLGQFRKVDFALCIFAARKSIHCRR